MSRYVSCLMKQHGSPSSLKLNFISLSSTVNKSNNPNCLANATTSSLILTRDYTNNAPKRGGFLGNIIDSIKEEFNKNKEMKESISKFREEAKKLEQSKALQEARKKYKELEDEQDRGSKVLKEKIMNFGEKMKESDIAKKAAEFSGEMGKKAQWAAENVSKQTQGLSETAAFKKVSHNVKRLQENLDEATQISQIKPYRKPAKLRKRTEVDEDAMSKRVYAENTDATGMVLHKDSKFYQSWQNFKENNPYINKMFEFKSQYEESDNPVVRTARVLTDKFSDVFGNMFKSTEMSEVLTEIVKMEPSFELNEFLKRVQYDIIPNVMEALAQGELEILQDWCTETAYNIMTHPLKQCEHLKMKYHNEVLDISHLDIAASKIMEQGPVLIVTFTAQQIIYVTDSKGAVVEGDKDKIKRVHHVWALCRDQSVLDPNAAWRVMECAMNASEMFV